MNFKLVDSLVQLIESLDIEEYALLQDKLQNRIIQKTAGVCGGHACIRQTRIPVWTVISLQQQGADYQEIIRNFPSLTIPDLSAVQAYYENNKVEIDRVIAYHQDDADIEIDD
ncbi:DUF433 domain-containing protein [Planktothrix sp. FACHB-1355]|uniref:DUF433 domain-containing protein n=1 Tax=Aerosakkonema funiforme FACHB-1375 TaxID=2949571 RepID=A0A926ZJ69_9CYAN|nr:MULTISPECIES: DUF433 domain-containing protein [Oscillatoriales]MBD2184042.1 DUF433 domain-containing protein [Aerosakkonema funiforme FACHB-1375]MBD3558593.1 DUF433 domain-containing protein [Planktothrix sp. FACHB-1355]